MDLDKLQKAGIRFFWSTIFPAIGFGIDWAIQGGNLETIGVNDAALVALFTGVAYGLKKYFFSETKW